MTDAPAYHASGIRSSSDVPFAWYVLGPKGEVAFCQCEGGETHANMIADALNAQVATHKAALGYAIFAAIVDNVEAFTGGGIIGVGDAANAILNLISQAPGTQPDSGAGPIPAQPAGLVPCLSSSDRPGHKDDSDA